MKLSDWAKEQGISYRTAWRWFKADQLPIKAKATSLRDNYSRGDYMVDIQTKIKLKKL